MSSVKQVEANMLPVWACERSSPLLWKEADNLDCCYGDSGTRVSAETERIHNNDGTLLENAAVFKTIETHTHSRTLTRTRTPTSKPELNQKSFSWHMNHKLKLNEFYSLSKFLLFLTHSSGSKDNPSSLCIITRWQDCLDTTPTHFYQTRTTRGGEKETTREKSIA